MLLLRLSAIHSDDYYFVNTCCLYPETFFMNMTVYYVMSLQAPHQSYSAQILAKA
jgi:hypothetical protein